MSRYYFLNFEAKKFNLLFQAEREILLSIDSPFILKLFKTFKDNKYVYLLTEALIGGELFTLMKRCGPLEEEKSVFAVSCILEALDYLHTSLVRHGIQVLLRLGQIFHGTTREKL